MKNEDLIQCLKNPNQYLQYEKLSLEQRLNKIDLSEEEIKEIESASTLNTSKTVVKKIVDNVSGGFFEPLIEIANWQKDVDANINTAKKTLLISKYLDKCDNMELGLEQLFESYTDIYGQTLIGKVNKIIEDSPLDEDMISALSNTLKVIVDEKNFEKVFSRKKYILNLISSINPQSLIVLKDYVNWPEFSMGASIAFGSQVSDFENVFSEVYSSSKKIKDKSVILSSVLELSNKGLIICLTNNQGKYKVNLTELGEELYKIIT